MIKKAFGLTMLLLAVSVSGVYATWKFSEAPPSSQSTPQISVTMNTFNYKPEEILPSTPGASQIGENHLDVIEKIIHEASYGLNATKKPIIHNLLNKVGDVVYCKQKVQGGNLKHLMIDGTGAYNLLFQVEYVSESEYIVYTYLADDAEDNPQGTEIEVYKTIIVKDSKGVWDATYSYYGLAKTTKASGLDAINSYTWYMPHTN